MSIRESQPKHLKAIAEARTNPIAVSFRLKTLREAKELSQSALAKRVSISQQAVAAIESCRVDTPRYLDIIAEGLGVSGEYLRSGRQPGVPLYHASELTERSAYPRDDSEFPLTQAMLVPHFKQYSERTFALEVIDIACAASGAPPRSLVVIDPEVEPTPGCLVCVHIKTGPTLRRFRDTGGEPQYVPDNADFPTLDAKKAKWVGTVIEIRVLLYPA